MFFRVFRHYFRKTLRKFAVFAPIELRLTAYPLFEKQKVRKIKIDHFSSKKFKFWAKKRRKNGFFGVFRQYFRKTLRTFAVLLQLSSNLQGSRLFDCRRCANNKNGPFFKNKLNFWPKNLETTCFLRFSDIT